MSKLIEFSTRLHTYLSLSFYHFANFESNSSSLYVWPLFHLSVNILLTVIYFNITTPNWKKFGGDVVGVITLFFHITAFVHGFGMVLECVVYKKTVRNLFRQIRKLQLKFQISVFQASFEKKLRVVFVKHLTQMFVMCLHLTLEMVANYYLIGEALFIMRLKLYYHYIVLLVRSLQMPLMMNVVTVYLEMCAKLIQVNTLVFDLSFYNDIQETLNRTYEITKAINKSLGTSLFFYPIVNFIALIFFVYALGMQSINHNIKGSLGSPIKFKLLLAFFVALYTGWVNFDGSKKCEKMVKFILSSSLFFLCNVSF